MTENAKPRVAVWKFASCDGCQLSLLDCEDELLTVADKVEIVHFLEATSASQPGPYDVSIVEGSVSAPWQVEAIHEVREQSKFLITVGACATAGGIQALRNYAKLDDYVSVVYARPDYIDSLETSTPISDHVHVDYELRGCPINRHQLLELIAALLGGRHPNIRPYSVCVECKRRGTVCIMVSKGIPCLGPVTHAGCEAICPAHNRGCFGCYGPQEYTNCSSLQSELVSIGMSPEETEDFFHSFNAWSEPFRNVTADSVKKG